MKLIVILLVVAVVVVVLLRMRRPPAGASKTAVSKVKTKAGQSGKTDPRPAVSIKPGPDACEAARALAGKRILAAETTALPLPDCTVSGCSCRFEHHEDRREADGEKRALSALSTELYQASGKAERRFREGRRTQD